MFNEPASTFNDYIPIRKPTTVFRLEEAEAKDSRYTEIREAVETVFAVDAEQIALSGEAEDRKRLFFLPGSRLLITYTGQLKVDSEAAYAMLDAQFQPHDLFPIFRDELLPADPVSGERTTRHQVFVVQGRIQPKTGGGWLSLILFVMTVFSVLFVGALMAIQDIAAENEALADQMLNNLSAELWRGLPYAASILLILGAHELGHYFAARYHKTAASLPYFIPFPFGIFGTFGAAITLREPMRNRKILLDIGAAGPLTGLIFAVPILLIGLATSDVGVSSGGLVEGNSLLYAFSKILVFGEFLPNGGRDVFVNQLAWAGWTGLFVTGLNLIPVGQLDGGHILYALTGRFAKAMYYPILISLLVLALFFAPELTFFVILIVLFGNLHAVPLDDITRLDPRRRAVAVFALIVFALTFVPTPLQQIAVSTTPLPDNIDEGVIMLPVAMILLWQFARRRMRG